ncbi:MAG: hypothetical protein ACR2GL_07895, partial [Thermoleophilaceae bacterium]
FLKKLRGVPCAPGAARVLDGVGAGGRLVVAGRSLSDDFGALERQTPVTVLDAVLGWVAGEAGRFRAGVPPLRLSLRLRPRDAVLIAGALVPVAALLL